MNGKRFGRNDLILISGLLGAAVIAFVLLFLWKGNTSAGQVVITVDGEEYGVYNLSEDQQIEIYVDGVHTNTLEIADGTAKMIYADCPDKLCMHQSRISMDGQSIVCLPNRVVATVSGSGEDGFDSMVR